MPLEIRELVIKATVNNENPRTSNVLGTQQIDDKVGINEVVERVLEIIKEKSER